MRPKSDISRLLGVAVISGVCLATAAHAVGLEGIDTSSRKQTSIESTNAAIKTYDATGSVDVANGATRVEQCQCDYEVVAASQTDQVLGGVGGVGDYLQSLWAVPVTTSPGAVTLKDGSGSAITLFAGGAVSIADLKPFLLALPQNASSIAGAWKLTTGANISVITSGRYSP